MWLLPKNTPPETVTFPAMSKSLYNVPAPLHIPPDKTIFAVPVDKLLLTVMPEQVKVSEVVAFIVPVEPIVNNPEILQLPLNVLVVPTPLKFTGPGNVLPPLVIVDAAEIAIDPVPETVQL